MNVFVSARTSFAFLRLASLALLFVCLFHSPAAAQSCGANCTVVFAGDNNDNICYTTTAGEVSCPGGNFSLSINFGQTIDFFQPVGVSTLDAHTATSGTCGASPPHTCSGDGIFAAPGSGNMTGGTDYKVTFDGTGGKGVGSYPFFCVPHGFTMTGTIVVNPDGTSTSVTLSSGSNPSVHGQTIQFQATVSNGSVAGITPTGSVVFKDFGSAISSSQPLVSGSATFTTSSLTPGNHSITATYTPDVGSFSGSDSTGSPLSQDVQDFSISVSNPAGSALPCPGGPVCPAGEFYDYNGTLSAIDGYPTSVNLTFTGSPPSSCALQSPTNPVAMGSAFTVRCSNTAAAPTFNFNVHAASSSGFSISHDTPLTLNVGSFNFGALSPTSVSAVQGNPSGTTTFQVSALGTFSGEVDMSCVSPPSGVTCLFANGASTQALFLGVGQTMNDTLTLDTSSSVAAGPYTVTMQATPVAAPSSFQQRTLSLSETAGGSAVKIITYFGSWQAGQTDQPLNVLPVFPIPSSPPGGYIAAAPASHLGNLVMWGKQSSFKVSVSNWALVNAAGAQLAITFSQPVLAATATVTAGTVGGESCGALTGGISITCNLGTIFVNDIHGSWTKEVTVSVTLSDSPAGVAVEFFTTNTNQTYTDSKSQNSTNIVYGIARGRPRPLVRPGQMPGNTNPK